MGSENTIKGFDSVSQYTQNGQRIVNECRQTLEKINVPIWANYKKKDEPENSVSTETTTTSADTENAGTIKRKQSYTRLSNPANRAYTKFVKLENHFINSASSSEGGVSDTTILSTGRIVETMETIDEAGKRHLSFLTESAPESGCVSGSVNGYYENGTSGNTSIFLGNVQNSWQNKNKDIYTKFNATIGVNSVINNQSRQEQNKVVGNVSFDGRLEKKKMIYGAGVEYNSYSNNSQILDIHVAGKYKHGPGADLTRRTTITKDDQTGESATVSSMKLKLDIVSNKTDDDDNQPSEYNPFSFETGGSALPSEVTEVNDNARQLASQYVKPNRKNGSDLDFEYTENKCGITYEYNHNVVDKQDKFLSVAPVIGVHDYTDQTLSDNNESLEMTGGLVTQFGSATANGQTISGSVTAMTDRIVKSGSHPYDSNYLLANVQYSNTKAKLNAEIDAGALKSGDVGVRYVNLNAEKQMKNSSLGLSAGIARFKIADESSNLYNVMATYKYNIPYKTKK